MSTFAGILLDLSGSMRNSVGDGVNEDGGTWARSIFTVIDDLIKHDVSDRNHVFALGVGAIHGKETFDIIGTIKHFKSKGDDYLGQANEQTIDKVFKILEKKGARTIRKWATYSVVSPAMKEYEARFIYEKLKSDEKFTEQFVYEYLPLACRDWDGILLRKISKDVASAVIGVGVASSLFGAAGGIAAGCGILAHSVFVSTASQYRQATVEDVDLVVKQSITSISDSLLLDLSDKSIFRANEAAGIIRGCVSERDLTSQRAQELLDIVDPFIYGRTPLYAALTEASDLFLKSVTTHQNHRRLLFVLSDGEPTDEGNIDMISTQLRDADVTIVGCYISRSSNVDPRKLYSIAEPEWEDGAKFLLNLSSSVPTESIVRAIFIKHGWQIDITNNETRLFMHVNHPDNLKDVCELTRKAVCCQDALSDVLVSISLDIYINERNTSIKAHEQVGGTCYANASAAVLHLAMHRILGRDNGYPDFDELRDDMINRFGRAGANTFHVLQEVCPSHRLHCQSVDVNGAMAAVAAKRPVVAKFRLTAEEWNTFGQFYRTNPTGILKKSDLDIGKRKSDARTDGHAVVLASYNNECLRLMNSWGDSWAEMGFFRVDKAENHGLEFIDVFWTLNDLSDREKEYYRKHGAEVAGKLMRSLQGLHVATFTCPYCRQTSNVTEFSGTISQACCPKCHREFWSNDGEGNILALNMYLTSLSR